jgi:Abnormal spindle-like microcephaly-assoc'd, ASPM-SPD-2-Hydin
MVQVQPAPTLSYNCTGGQVARTGIQKLFSSVVNLRGFFLAVFFSRSSASAVRGYASVACLVGVSFLFAGCASYNSQTSVPASGPALTVSANSFNFNTVVVGQTATQTLHLTNSGNAPLQISSISLSNKQFALSGPSLPRTVLPALGLDYTLAFAPTTAGNASASVTIASNAPHSPAAISLAGVAEKVVVALQATPASINFGNETLQATSTKNVTLQNTGDVSITINGVTATGSGFGYSSLSPGFSLSPNQQVTFQVWFRPQTSGAASGTVSILSANLSSPETISLTGDGVSSTPAPPPAATQHTVHLTWNPSSSVVAGYRVYRSTTSGTSYSPLFSAPLDALAFDDSSVTNGDTYYYVVTAIDGSGGESLYSNQVTANVPAS